jgi:hypothetical protein
LRPHSSKVDLNLKNFLLLEQRNILEVGRGGDLERLEDGYLIDYFLEVIGDKAHIGVIVLTLFKVGVAYYFDLLLHNQ